MNDNGKRYKVVIVGGGFAGIAAARVLAKKGLHADITLISKQPRFQYYPNLYRLVVGATVNQVSIPLAKTLPENVTLLIDTYTGIDQAAHTIVLASGTVLPYDFLVLALGSEPNYFGIDGMEAHSKSFLSVDKALALKQYFSETLQAAKMLPAEEAKIKLHTVIVGAGPSGVELAGVLRRYLVCQAKKAGVDPKHITIDLLDSLSRVLPAVPEHASALVAKQLQKKGVTILANYGVNSCDEDCITIKSTTGEEKQLRAGTVIWTAGTKINSAFSTIPNLVLTDRKRVQVSPTLTLPNDDMVYIAGDGSGTPFSGLAQTAIDQGEYVGEAIAKRMRNIPVAPYEPKPGVFIIPIGKGWAILNYKQFVTSGLVPWLLRIAADAQYFIGITSLRYAFSMLRKDKTN